MSHLKRIGISLVKHIDDAEELIKDSVALIISEVEMVELKVKIDLKLLVTGIVIAVLLVCMQSDDQQMTEQVDDEVEDHESIIELQTDTLVMKTAEVMVECDLRHLLQYSKHGEVDEVEDDSESQDEVLEVGEVVEYVKDEMVECDEELSHEQVELEDKVEIDTVHQI